MSKKINFKNSSAPPTNASNEQIRKFSWKRTKACYWSLVSISFIGYIPAVAAMLFKIPFTGTIWAGIISYFLTLIFTPLAIGICAYSYDTYLNGKSEFNKIFAFFMEKRLIMTSFLLGLCNLFLNLINALPSYISDFLKNDKTMPNYEVNILIAGLSIFSFLFFFIYFYFLMRLYLINYIFIRDTSKKAYTIIKESFDYTKGCVHSILWYGITTAWWILFIIIIVSSIIAAILIPYMPYNLLKWIYLSIILFYMLIFLMPYGSIAMAGYAHKMIEENKPVKTKNKK